jgi:hypothetical protein
MRKLVALLLLLPPLSISKGTKPMSNLISTSHTVNSILEKIKQENEFEPSAIKSYQESPQVYIALAAKVKTLEGKVKVSCIEHYQELASVPYISPEDNSLSTTPYLGDLTLIHSLVEAMGDKDRDVRNAAAKQLYENVPDIYIRNFSKELIDHITAYPTVDNAPELLAKTGAERARALIRTNSALRKVSNFSTKKSLAKLGDSALENAFITSYKKEEDMREKRDLAYALGFIASPKTILTLAQDLRTPVTYPWNQESPRSFRVHVIEGLGMAYPMEAIFWRPSSTPRADAYYDGVEAWVTAHLRVTWKTPRPPFLYEMEAPSMP